MTETQNFNTQIIAEFRSNAGKVGGPFEGASLLLLHHRGRRTGAEHVTPLAYLPGDNCYYVFASNAGADTHPHWYRNIQGQPDLTVDVGTDTVRVRATELTGTSRDDVFQQMVNVNPGFADYAANTHRIIPVLALTPHD